MREIYRINYSDLALVLPATIVLFAAEKRKSKDHRMREAASKHKPEKRKSAAARLEEQKNRNKGSKKKK